MIMCALTLAGVLGLALAAIFGERSQAFTLGVTRAATTKVAPDGEVCQSPVAVPAAAAFDGVTFAVGTQQRPGPPLEVTVREADLTRPGALDGAVLARGTLDRGYPDVDRAPEHTVWLQRVPDEQTVAVCIRNRGRHPAFVYGNADIAARTSTAFLDGQPTGNDLALEFDRREPRSLASLVPAMVDRAALFRAGLIGPWTYWLLGGLVLLAVPALLVRALRSATAES
jgi:hypothetical protein